MRIIIRYSLDNGPIEPTIRNKANKALNSRGIKSVRRKTGVFEANDLDLETITLGVAEALTELSKGSKAKLDHFWMYIDKK